MSKIRSALKETYNTISSHFDSTRKSAWSDVRHFLDREKKGSLIIDLASGTGRHSVYAKSIGLNPIAGDFSISQLREIKKKDCTIPSVMLDLLALPFKSDTFSTIIFIAAIHHLETEKKRMNSLKESSRVLKLGSSILVSAWALDQPRFKNKPTKDGDIMMAWDKKYPRFYHLFKAEELETIAKKSGLEVLDSFRSEDNYYILGRKSKNTNGEDTR